MTNIWAKSFFIASLVMILAALVLFGFSLKASYEVGTWYDTNRTLISEKGGEYLAKFKGLDVLLGKLNENQMDKRYYQWVTEGKDPPKSCEGDASRFAVQSIDVAQDAYYQALVEVARFVEANMAGCVNCKTLLKKEYKHNSKMWKSSRDCEWLPPRYDPKRRKPRKPTKPESKKTKPEPNK